MHHRGLKFYGTGTIGKRGQIVIPAKARQVLKIAAGDKFIFFGHHNLLQIIKANQLDSILAKMTEKFTEPKELGQKIKGAKNSKLQRS